MPSILSSAFVASLFAVGAFAQTFTTCNPLNNTCAADMALGQYAAFDFTTNQANPALFNTTSPAPSYNANGAQFIIKAHGDAPTLQTTFTIFWGTVSVVMKASSGVGVVSSIVLLSDDLDEIDWEVRIFNCSLLQS
jgi:Glycosyl hydrolases family 16